MLSELLLSCATPLLTITVPRNVRLSKKFTLPVKLPAAAEARVAVKVTEVPRVTLGFDVVSVTEEAAEPAARMTSAIALDSDPAKLASPWYAATIECPPTRSEEVVRLALPSPATGTLPIRVLSAKKSIVPV